MATRDEIRVIQSNYYYELLTIQELNRKAGITVEGLKSAINRAKATMTEPEIAWVEKQVKEAQS